MGKHWEPKVGDRVTVTLFDKSKQVGTITKVGATGPLLGWFPYCLVQLNDDDCYRFEYVCMTPRPKDGSP